MDSLRKFLRKCVDNRNRIFIVQCFLVHFAYASGFLNVSIMVLGAANVISAIIYLFLFFIFKNNTEKGMIICYIEILIFSIFCEICVGPGYGFYLFGMGMVASLFYLIPSLGKKRFILQIVGAVIVLGVEMATRLYDLRLPVYIDEIAKYRHHFFILNLSITLIMMVENGILYATENDQYRELLTFNMNHDPLTNLYNRRFFEEWAHSSNALKDKGFTVAMMDIDDFKRINDNYGHEMGDEALVMLTKEIENVVESNNAMLGNKSDMNNHVIPVRWGGEEFIILFPNKGITEIEPMMEYFRNKVADTTIEKKGERLHITITIGIAEGLPGSNYEKVISAADKNLYSGKRSGKNKVVV